jgi:hypothetical protein
MTATDAQVRVVLSERLKGRTQQQAAVRANLRGRHTVAKYERLGRLPSALKGPRSYRTRTDPFAADWPELAAMLERAPELEAKTLFDWLRERRPAVYHDGQVRTLQRRVALWRVEHTSPVLTLEQIHRPGEVLQTDGTSLNHLQVTIAGAPFPHLLIHSVLPYSNWEWGRVAQSESLVALRLALGSALGRLGHVPRVHQTDRTSAATHRLVGVNDRGRTVADRGFNPEYLAMLAHYGLEPRMIHRASPNENGDVEAGNGATGRALAQHLLLRGSREFSSVAAYERFLAEVFEKRNAARWARLAEELAAMRPLTVAALPPEREVRARVSSGGMIRVLGHSYAVPAGLVGKIVTAWVGEWELGVWYGGRRWVTLPRQTVAGAHHVDYRYVVDTLLRKPGGFRNYRYRDDLFPTTTFRRAWEALDGRLPPRRADLAYLRVLKLAATTLEVDVERALAAALAAAEPWDDRSIAARVQPAVTAPPPLATGAVDLTEYDALLDGRADAEADDDAA